MRRFNNRFGQTFAEPMPLHKEPLRILGLDGKKMSKSLGNYIAIGDDPDTIRRRSAAPLPTRRGCAKKIPAIPRLLRLRPAGLLFGRRQSGRLCTKGCRSALRIGCVESKRALADAMIEQLRPIQGASARFPERPGYIDEDRFTLARARARLIAQATMAEVRERLGLIPAR